MIQEAWNAVKLSTIQHCWNHTGIQAISPAPSSYPAHADPEHLGSHYVEEDWADALKGVMDVEGDTIKAVKAVEKLTSVLQTLKNELTKAMEELTTHRQIIGIPLTIDKILDPQEEKNIGEVTAYKDDNALVAEV
ncbi:hypothetical protein EDD22DRAFT_954523 [Suillus occidentalis]|nr:hypothetical protein EDD22DRAFT_954523 [Suillus occidentalis]